MIPKERKNTLKRLKRFHKCYLYIMNILVIFCKICHKDLLHICYDTLTYFQLLFYWVVIFDLFFHFFYRSLILFNL